MHTEIRSLLIEYARNNKPIYYGEIMTRLGLKAGIHEDHEELSKVLADISRFEDKNGKRPLLSAMATYSPEYVRLKNLSDNHGNGFYELAESLGKGKKQTLKTNFFPVAEMTRCHTFWTNEDNYKKYYEIDVVVPQKHTIAFFTEPEIEFLASWASKVYDKNNQEHIAAKNYIMDSLGTKTRYWSNELVKLLPGFEAFNWRMWSQKGWEDTPNGKIRVARFKHYTWARIYKKGDENKDIFFTVGVSGPLRQLEYKLDYYFEKNSHLNNVQKGIVEKNIPKELRSKTIGLPDIKKLDWNSLLQITSKFIAENTSAYDRLINLAWKGQTPQTVFTNCLNPQPFPKNGYSELPVLNPQFNGTDMDFIREAIEKKEIGDAGEELVKKFEKETLHTLGLYNLEDQVCIVENGKGYDVLSFQSNGSRKYIEVKTTVGNERVPFHFSLNEYLFAEKNKGNYCIYRLYNFDEDANNADFYVIDDPLNTVFFQAVNYKAYIKRQEG